MTQTSQPALERLSLLRLLKIAKYLSRPHQKHHAQALRCLLTDTHTSRMQTVFPTPRSSPPSPQVHSQRSRMPRTCATLLQMTLGMVLLATSPGTAEAYDRSRPWRAWPVAPSPMPPPTAPPNLPAPPAPPSFPSPPYPITGPVCAFKGINSTDEQTEISRYVT